MYSCCRTEGGAFRFVAEGGTCVRRKEGVAQSRYSRFRSRSRLYGRRHVFSFVAWKEILALLFAFLAEGGTCGGTCVRCTEGVVAQSRYLPVRSCSRSHRRRYRILVRCREGGAYTFVRVCSGRRYFWRYLRSSYGRSCRMK